MSEQDHEEKKKTAQPCPPWLIRWLTSGYLEKMPTDRPRTSLPEVKWKQLDTP